jgi:hypothetical protein
VNGYICCLLAMAPSLAIDAEAIHTPICGKHCFTGSKLTAKRCRVLDIGCCMKHDLQVVLINL